jgi:hypothetical protein
VTKPLTDLEEIEVRADLRTMRDELVRLQETPPIHHENREEYVERTSREIARLERLLDIGHVSQEGRQDP